MPIDCSEQAHVFGNLTVVILTYNEEKRLQACLDSLPKGVKILVLDSGSDDKTEEIAKSYSVKFIYKPFHDFARQRNTALGFVDTKWVMMIDADEVCSPTLAENLKTILTVDKGFEAYRINRRLVFLNRKMYWGKTSDRPIRIFKKGSALFIGSIHESLNIDKRKLGTLGGGCLWHYSYENLTDYFARFNRYTTAIATQHKTRNKTVSNFLLFGRFWFDFLYRYIFRLGFLDGYPGYVYALISSMYSFIKYAKLKELADQ